MTDGTLTVGDVLIYPHGGSPWLWVVITKQGEAGRLEGFGEFRGKLRRFKGASAELEQWLEWRLVA